MKFALNHLAGGILAAALPVTLLGFSSGPPQQRTGATVDGGITCTACHQTFAPVNSDPRGRVSVQARDYTPGVKQMLRVMVEHPEAMRWGFQLTARLASDESRPAGTFTMTPSIRVRCTGGAPDGACAGNQEFASHVAASTQLGQPNSGSFDIEWTPPATDVGDVIFYVAGNAANGNGNNMGDRIYNSSLRIKAAAACNLTARPTISAIRNGASFLDGPLAMNTMITIGGTGFQAAGVNAAVGALDLVDNKFPTNFSCIAVEVGGTRAPITFANPTQINAQVPTTTALGNVQVVVIVNPGTPNEQRSAPFGVQMSDYSPAFFRLLPTPCIAAVFAGTAEVSGDPSLLQNVRGAKPGETLSLFLTGLAATDPVYLAGEIPGGPIPVRDPVTIEWNGTALPAAAILYAGAAPGNITGLYQINLQVPANARPNSHNTVRVRIGGVLSPDGTTLYVAP